MSVAHRRELLALHRTKSAAHEQRAMVLCNALTEQLGTLDGAYAQYDGPRRFRVDETIDRLPSAASLQPPPSPFTSFLAARRPASHVSAAELLPSSAADLLPSGTA